MGLQYATFHMPPTRISVALCTYNGSRFLQAQLRSILEQTRLPDEVVICDDSSTDSTPLLLKDFARTAPFPVRVECNRENLGSTKNFEKAVALCAGDLIAFSDQDDLWSSDRLALSEQAFLDTTGIGLAFGDGALINDQDQPSGKSLWEHYQFGLAMQARLAAGDYLPCIQWRFVTGATMMVSAAVARQCFPVGEGWIHDEWLAAAVPLYADILPLSTLLISYRLHASQQIGATRQFDWRDKILRAAQQFFDVADAEDTHWGNLSREAARTQVVCTRFASAMLTGTGQARRNSYEQYLGWLRLRLALPRSRVRRLAPLLRHYAIYQRYATLGSMVKDLLLPRRT